MARTRDMTQGNPTRLILLFSLPIAAGNLLQQLYNIIDTLVIGRGEGVVALAAVSGSGWLDWAVLSITLGLAQGFAIQIAQSFGAGEHGMLRRAAGQSILLSIFTVLFLELGSQLFLNPLLHLLRFPDNTFALTERYLRIIFAGMGFVMAYNLLAGFLQAVGNSRTPLLAMIAATCTNVALDMLFVLVFRWGVSGAALATVLSQAVSFCIALIAVIRLPLLHITRDDLWPDRHIMSKLLHLGMPIAFGNLVISLGGLVLQRVVNGFGFIFMAGYNAASRLQGMIELFGTAIGAGVSTFSGQNCGAGRFDRVREGVRKASLIAIIVALLITAALLIWGKPLLSLFMDDDPQIVDQVLTYGYRFLIFMAIGLPFLYLLFTHRSALQGLGDTLIPMISGFVELAFRVLCSIIMPLFLGEWGVYFSEISAWIGAAALLIIGYQYRMRRLESGKNI